MRDWPSARRVAAEIGLFFKYAGSLPKYLRTPVSRPQGLFRIHQQFQDRSESFLRLLRCGVYPYPHSTYRKLLNHFGISYPDIENWVRRQGIEYALNRLYAAGVYISLDEFKLRKPIRRGSLVIEPALDAFDNPLGPAHSIGVGRGSRTKVKRNKVDLELLSHEAAYYLELMEAFGLRNRPIATWRSVPPDNSGINVALRFAKIGQPLQEWFSPLSPRSGGRFVWFLRYTLAASRRSPYPIPVPKHVPLSDAAVIARWLASVKSQTGPAVLHTPSSGAVRVCMAAQKHDLDIAGSFFLLTGEPCTSAKSNVLTKSGCEHFVLYHTSEAGVLGLPCTRRRAVDDIHLLNDKTAFLIRSREINGRTVDTLVLTTLMASCPKLMLNVETDDYGVLYSEHCGCPIGELGYVQKMHSIHSYEKLTSEGINFLGTELARLLEEVLPHRFGGHPIDYQIVEVEENGLSRVRLIIDPEVGTLDDALVVRTCLDFLRSVPGGEIMTEVWAQGDTLQVMRRHPYTTSSSKLQPVHVLKQARSVETESGLVYKGNPERC